jgi:hypothetical protein
MTRPFTLGPLVVVVVCAAAAAEPAAGQVNPRLQTVATAPVVAPAQTAHPQADLHGVVIDEGGGPLAGAVVSALGSTTAFAVSDPEGRFALRDLPFGPYLVRAHLQGYLPARGRIIQVNRATHSVSTIALTRRGDADGPPQVLAAGVGPADATVGPGAAEGDADVEAHDHGEVAWRLRHLKRGVLKDATTSVLDTADNESFLDDPFAGVGRAVGYSARVASSLLADLPLNGQFDLLTSTSFDRPQDLFSGQTWLPRGVAFLSLEAPTGGGDWTMRGAVTQGDLASWILAGSYVRRASASHQYEAGLSYAMQRYRGGNADALASVSDGNRNVGTVYAYDEWTVSSRLTVSYGAKYARHDYLGAQGLLSPRASVTVSPSASGTFRVRATVSRREVAPGAEEFIPPASGLWLPPERTFSPISPPSGFRPERLDHLELAAEQDWRGGFMVGVRAFHQTVDDQLVTLFGVALPGGAPTSVGHYYVGSGGDFEARGWGLSLSRDVADRLSASVDYTQIDTAWIRRSPEAVALSLVSASAVRDADEVVRDVTTSLRSVVPVTDTQVFVVYKINSGFADAGTGNPRAGTRFDVQLTQALPFLNFNNAQWEMLVAVRNLFRDEFLDASVYDELLVVRPPKRVVGGVTVRF